MRMVGHGHQVPSLDRAFLVAGKATGYNGLVRSFGVNTTRWWWSRGI